MDTEISIVTHSPIIEDRLGPLRATIGSDFDGYRGHLYRVLTYTLHWLGEDSAHRETIETALVYHDVALWTDQVLAYLEPSATRAQRDATAHGWDIESQLMHDIIVWHHKITPFRGAHADVVNAVRKADWIDASQGRLRKGIARATIEQVQQAIPAQGFYDTLDRLGRELSGGSRWRAFQQFRRVFRW